MHDNAADTRPSKSERIDSRRFTASEEQFDEFLRLLDEPLPSTQKFQKLFTRPSRFDEARAFCVRACESQ